MHARVWNSTYRIRTALPASEPSPGLGRWRVHVYAANELFHDRGRPGLAVLPQLSGVAPGSAQRFETVPLTHVNADQQSVRALPKRVTPDGLVGHQECGAEL